MPPKKLVFTSDTKDNSGEMVEPISFQSTETSTCDMEKRSKPQHQEHTNLTAENDFGEKIVVNDAQDLVTHVLHVDDDASLSPWTFRAFFIGKYPTAVMIYTDGKPS
jgi:hypothetical protein